MRLALVNPPWDFADSVYFGCREPHLPLELGYAKALLEAEGHDALVVDCQLEGLDLAALRRRTAGFAPEISVVVTAPSYLFWRCPPPELREPKLALDALRGVGGLLAAAGPHPSVTPAAAEAKLDADLVLRGELEAAVLRLAAGEFPAEEPVMADLERLPALAWPDGLVRRHVHQHHRFDAPPRGLGAEVEGSRGCPFSCAFCAKEGARGAFRRRPREVVLAEIDALTAQGVEYVYFIDELFLPDRRLLKDLAEREVRFGAQTRVDLWEDDDLELLGRAGCVSVEAGVESLSPAGRERLGKRCRLSTEELTRRLVLARRFIPFVQANLIRQPDDDAAAAARWRELMRSQGVWANDPVPLFPYPGSPAYRERFGPPDDLAWERAHAGYLEDNDRFCDLQAARPRSLAELEADCGRVNGRVRPAAGVGGPPPSEGPSRSGRPGGPLREPT